MSVEIVLDACRIAPEDSQLTPEILEDLAGVYALVQHPSPGRHVGDIPHAVALLTAALGQLPRFNPTHLPFGFAGPRIQSIKWVDLDRIDLIMKQVVGLCQQNWDLERVTFAAQCAVSDASASGLIEKKDYDGWVPGMASGSGWRTAVCVTPLGLTRARQAANKLNAASVPGNPPPPSQPKYPWRKAPADQVAAVPTPALSAPDPFSLACESDAELLPQVPAMPAVNASAPPAEEMIPILTALPPNLRMARLPSKDDLYKWARQVELVKATNQVLGEGELNPGVLSKACKAGEILTNLKPGRAGMAEVKSYLIWLGKKRELGKEELDQVRNAIIGEISSRN